MLLIIRRNRDQRGGPRPSAVIEHGGGARQLQRTPGDSDRQFTRLRRRRPVGRQRPIHEQVRQLFLIQQQQVRYNYHDPAIT
jgi:hypothetical protein